MTSATTVSGTRILCHRFLVAAPFRDGGFEEGGGGRPLERVGGATESASGSRLISGTAPTGSAAARRTVRYCAI